ncbi:MAG: hypothetical protein ACKV1O_09535, partial [Saprospiraceae bacterium]
MEDFPKHLIIYQIHKTKVCPYRFLFHNAISNLKENEELKIFFLTFKFSYGGHMDFTTPGGDIFNTWFSKPDNSKEYKNKIDLEHVQNSINRLQAGNFVLYFVRFFHHSCRLCLQNLPRLKQNFL